MKSFLKSWQIWEDIFEHIQQNVFIFHNSMLLPKNSTVVQRQTLLTTLQGLDDRNQAVVKSYTHDSTGKSVWRR